MDGARYSEDGPALIVEVEDITRKEDCMATGPVNTDLTEILPKLDDPKLRWKLGSGVFDSVPYLKLQYRRWYGWIMVTDEPVLTHGGTVESRIREAANRILSRKRKSVEARKFYGTTS